MKAKPMVLLAASLSAVVFGLLIWEGLAPDQATAQGPPEGGFRRPGPPLPGAMPPLALAADDGYVYVLQGPTLIQFRARDLQEVRRVDLKVERPFFGPRVPRIPAPPEEEQEE